MTKWVGCERGSSWSSTRMDSPRLAESAFSSGMLDEEAWIA